MFNNQRKRYETLALACEENKGWPDVIWGGIVGFGLLLLGYMLGVSAAANALRGIRRNVGRFRLAKPISRQIALLTFTKEVDEFILVKTLSYRSASEGVRLAFETIKLLGMKEPQIDDAFALSIAKVMASKQTGSVKKLGYTKNNILALGNSAEQITQKAKPIIDKTLAYLKTLSKSEDNKQKINNLAVCVKFLDLLPKHIGTIALRVRRACRVKPATEAIGTEGIISDLFTSNKFDPTYAPLKNPVDKAFGKAKTEDAYKFKQAIIAAYHTIVPKAVSISDHPKTWYDNIEKGYLCIDNISTIDELVPDISSDKKQPLIKRDDLLAIMKYYTDNPLFTSKIVRTDDWKKVYQLMGSYYSQYDKKHTKQNIKVASMTYKDAGYPVYNKDADYQDYFQNLYNETFWPAWNLGNIILKLFDDKNTASYTKTYILNDKNQKIFNDLNNGTSVDTTEHLKYLTLCLDAEKKACLHVDGIFRIINSVFGFD